MAATATQTSTHYSIRYGANRTETGFDFEGLQSAEAAAEMFSADDPFGGKFHVVHVTPSRTWPVSGYQGGKQTRLP